MRSMTGFGRGEASLGSGVVRAEVRSVNSRHLEVRLRAPRELAAFETELRALAGGFFHRGQVDVAVRLPPEGVSAPVVALDLDAARRYAGEAERLRAELGLQDRLSLDTLLGLPGVTRVRDPELDADAVGGALRAAVGDACRAAAEMRAREGEALAVELRRRARAIEGALAEIEARADEVRRGLRARLDKRLRALAPELELDPGRIEQEVLLYADRMDVTEEVVRIRSHLAQLHETLEQVGPVGRKLEFLLQELGRELNTIGSKAADASITHRVVELKAELEKLREQVLNVE